MRDSDLTICDKCETDIIDGFCSCGQWATIGDLPLALQTFGRALVAFNTMGIELASQDHTEMGVCSVYFKGDYDMCVKVTEFVEKLQGEGDE